jgi:transcriptional regulator of acetoin/glycerol metabolism
MGVNFSRPQESKSLMTAFALQRTNLCRRISRIRPGGIAWKTTPPSEFHAAVREAKRKLICAALSETNGNYTQAAKKLGLQRNYFHRLVRNLQMRDVLKPPSSSVG